MLAPAWCRDPSTLAVSAMGSLKPGCACSRATGAWCVPRKGPLEHSCPHDGAAGAKCVSGQGCSMYVCTHVCMTHAQVLTPGDCPPQTHLLWDSLTPHEPTMVPVPRISRWMWWQW